MVISVPLANVVDAKQLTCLNYGIARKTLKGICDSKEIDGLHREGIVIN